MPRAPQCRQNPSLAGRDGDRFGGRRRQTARGHRAGIPEVMLKARRDRRPSPATPNGIWRRFLRAPRAAAMGVCHEGADKRESRSPGRRAQARRARTGAANQNANSGFCRPAGSSTTGDLDPHAAVAASQRAGFPVSGYAPGAGRSWSMCCALEYDLDDCASLCSAPSVISRASSRDSNG